jgi:ribonuclease HII
LKQGNNFYYERKFKKQGCHTIIGIDEVGIGPLAGPVVAAAVTLNSVRFKNRIDDSKKLTPAQRERAFLEIIEKSVFGVGIINEKVIDRLNILGATRVAMEEALKELVGKLDGKRSRRIHILIDGLIKPHIDFPFTNIVKGDAKSKSIASASIIAKVIRDRIMCIYDKAYPGYGFLKHKGYPTGLHRLAVKKLGRTVIHRNSFTCG